MLIRACLLVLLSGLPAYVPAAAPPAVVAERYVSDADASDELDSLASWNAPDGSTWLFATAKTTHRLVVFDAASGRRLRTFGERGGGVGQFQRPNGIAVGGDRLFVVERDNRRVQVFALPDLRSLGTFGEAELRSPYGLWLDVSEPGETTVYVTDSFMYGERFDRLPPLEEMDERVRRYRLTFAADGAPRAQYAGAFGSTEPGRALRMVESIAGDPAHGRLLVADERTPASTLREYRFDGAPTGRSLPTDRFEAEAEGVALWRCGDGGYWVTVDQLAPLTRFHLFDRRTLEPAGTFQGRTTAFTDGIALVPAGAGGFRHGALVAVHDDRAVTAFDLADVARMLTLDAACGR